MGSSRCENQDSFSPSTEDEVRFARRWSRFPGQAVHVSIALPNEGPIDARIANESFGGMALLIDAQPKFHVGEEVQVVCDRFGMRGLVRRIEERENGRRLVAIEWLDRRGLSTPIATSSKRRFIARFVHHDNLLIVCQVSEPPRSGEASVGLPGGANLKIESKQVFARTLGERREELMQTSAALVALATVYGLSANEDDAVESLVEQILDFEFRAFYSIGAEV